MLQETVSCRFSGCDQTHLKPENAYLPPLEMIGDACRKRVVVSDLVYHAFCQAHAEFFREHSARMYPYLNAVQTLKRQNRIKLSSS